MSFWRSDYRALGQTLTSGRLGVDLPQPNSSEMRIAAFNPALVEEMSLGMNLADMGSVSAWIQSAPQPMAMAYAGHQYGHFTMLGDGRAQLLGEWQNDLGICYDVHLKGSGPTPFARGGDGYATLHAMLREFIITEALHALGVPTTRSLMVLETPYKVWREMDQRGGMLLRTAPHHVRIGTLEYAIRAFCSQDYARYVMAILNRSVELWNGAKALEQGRSLYGVGALEPEAVRCYFEEWSRRQAELLAHWMRVGFVHGVLNTDNISLMGMTLDLGPCAFVNAYDLKRSFSSIDQYGRYAWGRQSEIMDWNAGVLLSCLLPLLDGDRNEGRAVLIAQDLLLQYRSGVEQALKRMQWMKLGLDPQRYSNHEEARSLVSDWQVWLEESRPDYGLAYLNLEEILQQAMQQDWEPLTNHGQVKESTRMQATLDLPTKDWVARWIHFLEGVGEGACLSSLALMQSQNPSMIPRNHLVEDALDQKVFHDRDAGWDELLKAIREPYQRSELQRRLNQPPPLGDAGYCTFCGT